MENGHIGPVRFLTCVEIPKTNNQLVTDDLYRTVVISGGDGSQMYNLSEGQSSFNNNNNNNAASSYLSGSPVSTLTQTLSNSFMGSSMEETNIGKDDLVNYLLTWEIA